MKLKKVKSWLKIQREFKNPQFEVLKRDSNGGIYAVKRISDGFQFKFSGFYRVFSDYGGIEIIRITRFDENLIHVHFECSDSGRNYSGGGIIHIGRIRLAHVSLDDNLKPIFRKC